MNPNRKNIADNGCGICVSTHTVRHPPKNGKIGSNQPLLQVLPQGLTSTLTWNKKNEEITRNIETIHNTTTFIFVGLITLILSKLLRVYLSFSRTISTFLIPYTPRGNRMDAPAGNWTPISSWFRQFCLGKLA